MTYPGTQEQKLPDVVMDRGLQAETALITGGAARKASQSVGEIEVLRRA